MKSKKKILLTIILCLLCTLIMTSGVHAEEMLIGEKALITHAVITSRLTGEGPWDDNNDAGNDTDEDNNIIRSFDKIEWTIENTMALKEGMEGASGQGSHLVVEAALPENMFNSELNLKYAEWNLEAMAWPEEPTISEDGRILRTKYTLYGEEDISGARQTLKFVLNVLGAPNGLEIVPTFTMWLEGNEDSEKYVLTSNNTDETKKDSVIIVSATPKINILLKKASVTNYKSYFDFVTGKDVTDKNENTLFGRMQAYGITLQLCNTDATKRLKGIELPKGDITFDLTLGESMVINGETVDMTTTENFTPVLWDYKPNVLASNGTLGRTMYFQRNGSTRYACIAGPYNSGGSIKTSCYNGGIWTIEQDNTIPYLYHVTVSGYRFDNQYERGSLDAGDSERSAAKYGAELGTFCFSSGHIQVLLQVPDTIDGEETVSITSQVSNLDVTSLSGQVRNIDEKDADNKRTNNIRISPTPSFTKSCYFTSSNATQASATGDANVFPGYDGGSLAARLTVGPSNEEDGWLYGLDYLLKMDDEAIEPRLYESGAEYSVSGLDKMKFNVLYAGKPDKSGWNSDSEMIQTGIDDLVYFDTLAELKEEGYTCVACLIESTEGHAISGAQGAIYISYKAKDDAEVGKVYQITSDVRLYTNYNAPDRTTQTHTLTVDPLDYPEPGYVDEKKSYTKTAYDANGNIISGTHAGGSARGNSLLIKGANQAISIKTLTEDEEEKTIYDIGKMERTVTVELTPEISSSSEMPITGVVLKTETTIPAGVAYIAGTCEDGEPDKVENADGTTNLIWYKYNCAVNEAISPIRFQLELKEEFSNGTFLELKTVVSEEVGEGEAMKIGNTVKTARSASCSIQIINLASYSLNVTTETPIIESNEDGEYIIKVINKTDEHLENTFKILDVLPYVGDNRGTKFSGSYLVKNIVVNRLDNEGNTIDDDDLHLYISENKSVRSISSISAANYTNQSVWTEVSSGTELNKKLTGIGLQGTLKSRENLEVIISIKTQGNKCRDKYVNSVIIQRNPETEPMVSQNVKIEVIQRVIDGFVWYDENEDGLINEEEQYAKGITLKLMDADGNDVKDYQGNKVKNVVTDKNGYYQFSNLAKGEYIVKIVSNNIQITQKGVGSNVEINNKFNENQETDVLKKLDSADAPELSETFINAGIIKLEQESAKPVKVSTMGKVIVKYIDKDSGRELAQQLILKDVVGREYTTDEKEFDGYKLIENTDNTSGKYSSETIEVIYYYQNNQGYSLKYDENGHHEAYMKGYEDNTFRPEKSITREEVATIFYRLTMIDNNEVDGKITVQKKPFSDVEVDRWSANAISMMKKIGIINGYEDGSFRPDAPITRAEFAQIIMKYSKEKVKEVNMFKDVEEDYWARNAIALAISEGWINGYEDNTFKPIKHITRVETTVIINRMLKRNPSNSIVDKVKVFVVDLDKSHWGYTNVLEAIISHDYILDEDKEEIWEK